MKHILVILTLNMDQLPTHFQDILVREKEVVDTWKEAGILEHLFLRTTRDGAVFHFKGMEEATVRAHIETLPLYPLRKDITYLDLIPQF
jgi:hypothetical protein